MKVEAKESECCLDQRHSGYEQPSIRTNASEYDNCQIIN
jgi:hypothetical protein